MIGDLARAGLHLDQLAPLFGATFVLSNLVSNVPAVMLPLPLAHHEMAGPLLALVSSLSGNLLITGSISNIIVVDAAAAERPHRLAPSCRDRYSSHARDAGDLRALPDGTGKLSHFLIAPQVIVPKMLLR